MILPYGCNDWIEFEWHYITLYIQMEFFYFKTKFLGFQFMDIDNQRTLID